LAGCAGAGPYGHAPRYVDSGDEASVVSQARDYGEAHRDPSRKGPVTLFGIVQTRSPGTGGQALLKLGVTTPSGANVCARPGDDDSCRVTVAVGDRETVWALVSLRGEDDIGPAAVGQRSLVRIVGAVGQEVSPVDGAPVVHAAWYRQWPVGEYTVR
jgi:hypothetical protein